MIVPLTNGIPNSGLLGYNNPSTTNEISKVGLFSNTTAMLGPMAPGASATLPDKKIEEKRAKQLLKDLSPLTFPLDLSPEYYISFNAFKHSQERPQEAKRSFTFDKSLYLPLPSSITDSYSSSYNPENLYMFGNAAKEGLNALMTGGGGTVSAQNIMKNIPDMTGKKIADITDSLNQDPAGVTRKAAVTGLTYLMSGVGGPLAAAAKSSFQVTTNPYPVMIFQGSGLKPPFSFQWTLYPESMNEAMAIKKIIGYFRREMLPELMEGNESILKTPAVFEIKMVPDQNTRKFKRCVLTDMTVDYAPNGPSFIKERASDPSYAAVPSAVSIALTFREIEVWLADDFSMDQSNNFDVKVPVQPALPGVQGTVSNTDTRGIASGTPFGM